MFVSCVCCVGRGLCDDLIIRLEECYRVCICVCVNVSVIVIIKPQHWGALAPGLGCCVSENWISIYLEIFQASNRYCPFIYIPYGCVWNSSERIMVLLCVCVCVCLSVSTFPRYQHFNHLPEVCQTDFSLIPISNSTTLIVIKHTIYPTLADAYTRRLYFTLNHALNYRSHNDCKQI
jgi:hypothetical protein